MKIAGKIVLAAPLALSLSVVGCGSDGGGGGGQDTPDAAGGGVDNPYPGSENNWMWVPVEGTSCMNGSATGMGVNVRPGSDKLMIYLEGGGACFNSFTCSGVAHQNGFGETDLTSFARDGGNLGIFNRDDDDNPLRDYSFVFVPYCTGDIFAGDNENGFGGRTQVGYRNMGAYAAELAAKFEGVTQVVLAGSSAGGFGAAYNFDRVQKTFGDVPVTLLDDSGPPLSDTYLTPCLQQQIREHWNLAATLPADCAECNAENGGGLVGFTTYLAAKYPDRRMGIIASTRDGVIRLFYGWGYPNCDNPVVPMAEATYADGIAELRDEVLAPYDNMSIYTIDSGLHVWLFEDPVGSTRSGGVPLTDWIRDLVEGTGPLDHVIP